ncbi:MAG: radical SAM protein [Candidatus Thorarchaeota archaeon]
MKREISKKLGGSLVLGELPEGCALCTRGSKMVLFVTGLCSASCFYCPLSEEKANKDVVFADETPVFRDEDIIAEALAIGAEGAGISGGDPLCKLDRTLHSIRLLKDHFGFNFHIHLYTSQSNASASVMKQLHEAGLDEIRFHPQSNDWSGIGAARDIGLHVGLEIPVLPDRVEHIKKTILRAQDMKLSFVNLNELESSETNFDNLRKHGYRLRTLSSASILGSAEAAEEILRWGATTLDTISLHFCSASFKDAIQMRNRLWRRLEHVKREFEEVDDDDPLLILGLIRAPHGSQLDESVLRKIADVLQKEFDVPQELMNIDSYNHRIEIAPWILDEIASALREFLHMDISLEMGIAFEYPTWDRFQALFEPR